MFVIFANNIVRTYFFFLFLNYSHTYKIPTKKKKNGILHNYNIRPNNFYTKSTVEAVGYLIFRDTLLRC